MKIKEAKDGKLENVLELSLAAVKKLSPQKQNKKKESKKTFRNSKPPKYETVPPPIFVPPAG